jgi:hypothetical protein
MSDLDQSPFLWLEFDKRGNLKDPADISAVSAELARTGARDVVVISHGWKNDRTAALRLYGELWGNTRRALSTLPPQKILVLGVLWPSVAFRTNFDEAALLEAAQQGALAAAEGPGPEDISETQLQEALDDFLGDHSDAAFEALAAAASQDLSSAAAGQFVKHALARLNIADDPEAEADLAGVQDQVGANAAELLQRLADRPIMGVRPDVGGALGIGETLGGVFAGARAAVARLLNQLSFFEMKVRAGKVGAKLGELLADLPEYDTVRLHLVGHSFGARLVTSIANSLIARGKTVDTLTLLQGAFSHNALAPDFQGKPGAFAPVAEGGVGLIAVTHTHNDRACTLAYAVASRLSRDVASAVGDKDDKFGAMGANGAQGLAASLVRAVDAKPGTAGSEPAKGKVNNYKADAYVIGNPPGTDAHGDIRNSTVAKLLAMVLEA